MAALSVALLIGAAGWLVAGAGGWYLYSAGKAQVGPVSQPERATRRRRPPSSPSPAPAPIAPASPGARRGGRAGPGGAPAGRTPACGWRAAAACAGLGFIAEAQCMAAQCLKPQFRQHPQCGEVRRRQRLEEAKRNPVAP